MKEAFHIQDQKEYKDRVHRETNMRGMGNVNCTGEEEDGHSQKNFWSSSKYAKYRAHSFSVTVGGLSEVVRSINLRVTYV